MKKTISAAIVFTLILSLATAGYAAAYDDIQDAYDAWLSDGYPEWVSSVYEDSDAVSVVVTSEDAEDELMDMVDDTSSLAVYVDEDAIPHSELEQVYSDILESYYTGEDSSPVVSVSIGWISDEDGELIEFSSTGLECRVIVEVLSESLEEYEALFEENYGDAVYLVESETLDEGSFMIMDESTYLLNDEDSLEENVTDVAQDELSAGEWVLVLVLIVLIIAVYCPIKNWLINRYP